MLMGDEVIVTSLHDYYRRTDEVSEMLVRVACACPVVPT